MTEGRNHQEDMTLTNIYVPKMVAPKYSWEKLTELNKEIGHSAKIVEGFSVPISITDRMRTKNQQ
jgi:hypothetical protein